MPVDRVQHEVEQRRELEDLAIAAADQCRWGPVAGPHHRTDQLEVIGTRGGRVDDHGHCGAASVTGSVVASALDVVAVALVAVDGAASSEAGSSADAVSVSGGSIDAWSMAEV